MAGRPTDGASPVSQTWPSLEFSRSCEICRPDSQALDVLCPACPPGPLLNVTVVCDLLILPDHVATILQLATRQLSLPANEVAGRRFARLIQNVADPGHLLYLAEWTSQERLDAYRHSAPMPGTPAQYARPPDCRSYRRLASFERVLAPVRLVSVAFVDGPPATHAIRRDLTLAYYRAADHGRSGRNLFEIHEAADARPGLLILGGWDMPAAPDLYERPDQAPTGRALIGQLVAAGGAVSEVVGRALIETALPEP